jgi:hypothetical protein
MAELPLWRVSGVNELRSEVASVMYFPWLT